MDSDVKHVGNNKHAKYENADSSRVIDKQSIIYTVEKVFNPS